MKTKPLENRIAELRAEIDTYIDELVARELKTIKGVPAGVLRQTIIGQNAHCLCAAYRVLQQKEAA